MRHKTIKVTAFFAAFALLITVSVALSWDSIKQFGTYIKVTSYLKKVYGDQFFVNDEGEFCLETIRPGSDSNNAVILPESITMTSFDQDLIETNNGVTLEPIDNPIAPGAKKLYVEVVNAANQLLECDSDYTRFEKLICGNWYELSVYDTVEKALIAVNPRESAVLECSIWYPASDNKIVLRYPNGYTVDKGHYRIIWQMNFNRESEVFYTAAEFDVK